MNERVTAVRNDKVTSLAVSDLLVGDVVLIQTGEVVPADLKLLEASDLVVDEFELTGEIMPVEKHVTPEADTLVFEGSTVLRGHGRGVVIATGENTEYGKVLKQSSQYDEVENLPIVKKRHFLALLLLLVPVLLVRLRPYDNHELIYIAYGSLALSFLLIKNREVLRFILIRQRRKGLLRRHIFLRGNMVLDEMGKVDLFCFDKTGVLTSRDMKVRQVFIGGESSTGAKFYLTGRDIDKMSLSEVARQSEYISVFTRLTPSQKGTVVRAFQQRGHRVAMVGDGANDVIAFRFADAGLSFFEQSSPLARRTAKVLINDITDVLLVIRTAAHIREQVRLIALFTRVIFLAMLFASIYFSVKGLL